MVDLDLAHNIQAALQDSLVEYIIMGTMIHFLEYIQHSTLDNLQEHTQHNILLQTLQEFILLTMQEFIQGSMHKLIQQVHSIHHFSQVHVLESITLMSFIDPLITQCQSDEANGEDGNAFFGPFYSRGPVPASYFRQFTRVFNRLFSRDTGGPQYARSRPGPSI